MNVIDLFAGAGGFSSGFKKAGFDIILANEIDEMIAETYKKNHRDTLMINLDIKKLAQDFHNIINRSIKEMDDRERGLEITQKLNEVDVIIGGPPCQGFSMAGARIRKSNQFIEDPRNYLFKYYFHIIQILEPKYFIMENVPGLETMNGGAILEEIIQLFTDETNFKFGKYHLTKKLIMADELGVPQSRKRLFIIGSKFAPIDLDREIENTKIKINIPQRVTIEDAIGDLNYLKTGEGEFESSYSKKPFSKYQKQRRKNSKKLYNHVAPHHNALTLKRIKKIGAGENWTKLAKEEQIKSVHSGAYGRLKWDETSYTITTRFDTPSAGRVIHPEQDRALTPREAARLQSFDDDFIFYGNKSSIGKQIGNAVPPLVAEVLANIIKYDFKKRR